MIVRFFKTGTSNGETPVRYLMRETDHAGNARPEVPEVLEGSPETTVTVINSICRKHKYASGCLAFRSDEKPNKAQLLNILDQFKTLVAPGLEPEQFNALFVLHHEAPDPKTGQSGFHVHFLLPMTLLGGVNAKGKRLAGKRWNPHPPGKQSIEMMSLFTQITNHENGWQPVQEKPSRVGMDSLWRSATHLDQKRKIELLHGEVLKAIKDDQVSNRHDLMYFMQEQLGLTVTRASEKTVSVKFPGSQKAVRLRGSPYEHSTKYKQILSQHKAKVEQPNIDQAKERLAQLLSQKTQHITNTPTTTKRKERVYGKRSNQQFSTSRTYDLTQRTTAATGGAQRIDHRQSNHAFRASRLERTLLQENGGQWRDSHGGSHSQNGQGSGNTSGQAQQTIHVRKEPSRGLGPGQPWGGGQPIPTFNPFAEIAGQIRALTLQLNECAVGSWESKALSDQLCVLMGKRQALTGSTPIKPR